MSSIHTSRTDRSASFVFGLILTAIVLAAVLYGLHQLVAAMAPLLTALGGAA